MSFYVGTPPRTGREYVSRPDQPTLWERGQHTSFMFCAQLAAVEQMLRMPSGVVDTGMDEVYVDPPVLRAFIVAMFDFLGHNGSIPLRRMLAGVLQTALFVDARASGGPLPIPPGFEDVEEGLDDIS
ncbi:DUF6086 family protein [Actinoplanes siamensis]|nr:DUF6086 family protein [Actinoplanes siamensis]